MSSSAPMSCQILMLPHDTSYQQVRLLPQVLISPLNLMPYFSQPCVYNVIISTGWPHNISTSSCHSIPSPCLYHVTSVLMLPLTSQVIMPSCHPISPILPVDQHPEAQDQDKNFLTSHNFSFKLLFRVVSEDDPIGY